MVSENGDGPAISAPSEEVNPMYPMTRISLGLAVLLASGCDPLANPMLPGQHPITIVPEPTMVDLAPNFLAPGVPPADYPQVTIQAHVRHIAGFRGATLKAYAATYHEMNGTELTGAALPKQDFASAIALPAPGKDESIRVPITVALIHAGVTEFLRTQPPGSTINSRLTLYGEDPDRNAIAYSLNVPIRSQQP
jgi:hypothetical protein